MLILKFIPFSLNCLCWCSLVLLLPPPPTNSPLFRHSLEFFFFMENLQIEVLFLSPFKQTYFSSCLLCRVPGRTFPHCFLRKTPVVTHWIPELLLSHFTPLFCCSTFSINYLQQVLWCEHLTCIKILLYHPASLAGYKNSALKNVSQNLKVMLCLLPALILFWFLELFFVYKLLGLLLCHCSCNWISKYDSCFHSSCLYLVIPFGLEM